MCFEKRCRILHSWLRVQIKHQSMAAPFFLAVAKRPFPLRPTAPTNRNTILHQFPFPPTEVARRLVEETEAHVVVRLLLLLLGLLLSGSGVSSTTSGSSTTGSGTTSTTGGNRGELGGTFLDQLVGVLVLSFAREEKNLRIWRINGVPLGCSCPRAQKGACRDGHPRRQYRRRRGWT
jgi:hypothetical protein